MGSSAGVFLELLSTVHFSAKKHRDQRRKDSVASPYINHPIEVAETLARVGGVDDQAVLQAAILHDTIEDTETTPEELATLFGDDVRHLVEEVTDDKELDKPDRKRLQVEHAPHLSQRAKLIKLADKICNVRDVIHSPPSDWSLGRRLEYLDWTEQVVAGLRGASAALEGLYDGVLHEGRARLAAESASLAATTPDAA